MASNNEFYETILDNLTDGVYFVDRDKKVLRPPFLLTGH